MAKDESKITIPEGQEGVTPEFKKLIESGKVAKEQVIGFITIALVRGNPTGKVSIRYEYKDINTFSLPTLLKKVAKDIEDGILRGTGVV